MLRCYAIILCTTMLFPVLLFGQEQKSVRVMADEAFERQEYAAAGALYTKVAQKAKGKHAAEILMKVAACYSKIGQYDDAGNWYQRLQARPDCPSSVHLLYGEVLKSTGKYVEAKEQINKFKSGKADSMRLKNIMLAGCDSAIAWKSERIDMAMENIKELSSSGADWVSGVTRQGLLLVSNGYRKMSMNSTPERNPAIDARTNQPYFKAYLFKQYAQGVANTYVEEILPEVLGKVPYHVGPICFNPREDTLYVTLNSWQKDIANRRKRGPVNGERIMMIFWSVKTGDEWRPLEPLKEINNSGSSTGQVALSRDGQTMYFASNRNGGQGKMDIWYSEKSKNGRWGKPKNCGPFINTPFDEAFPTYNENGVLYFSSKGHPGMGGFDLFRATGEKTDWTILQNLRAPFNSGGDDLGFIMKANMYEGYFASNRPGGGGSDDVYRFMDTHFAERFNGAGGIQPYTDPSPVPDKEILASKEPAKPAEIIPDRPIPEKPVKESVIVASNKPPVVIPVAAPVVPVAAPLVAAPVSEPVAKSKKKKASVLTGATTAAEPEADPVVTSPYKSPVSAPITAPVIVSTGTPPVLTGRHQTGKPEPLIDSVTVPAVAAKTPVAKPVAAPKAESQPLSDMDNAILDKMEHLKFYYDFNSATLTTASREMLDRVAVVLGQYPDWKLMVRSYTDARGSDAYNKDLSALRCYAVIDYLIKKGIPSNKLYYQNIGKDPEDPCGKGVPCTERQYQASRRTMLSIIH
ncbi:WD40-like Beta Propeller Repeat [Chitinophaga sp. CF118]|uniref:OmpA family protein n=1 Tax=Chitinophaga sp. CF118 TaxID=1884367 RepID=UPI0008DF2AAD|nr:OmpA family protein [Chitinophaga sp. CF118]SFE06767.1 WD40-like Beta Propeller Repeat [Chitinophaga sp. CF118]